MSTVQDNNANPNLPWNQSGQADIFSKDPLHNVVIPGAGGSTAVINLDSVFVAPSNSGVTGTSRGTDATIASDVTRGEINNPLLAPPNPDILPAGSAPITFAALIAQVMDKISSGKMSSEEGLTYLDDVVSLYESVPTPAQPSGQGVAAGSTASSTAATSSTSTAVPLTQEELDEVSGLRSTDPAKILAALCTLYKLPPGDTSSSDYLALQTLATNLATGNSQGTTDDLDFSTLTKLQATLSQFSAGINDAVMSRITIALWELNNNWETNLTSTNPSVVYAALNAAVDRTKLSDSENQVVTNYLTILCNALAFMSQVRATIVQLNTEAGKRQSQAKLADLNTLSTLAQQNFSTALDQIMTQAKAELSQAAQDKLMSWLGPVIAVAVGLVSLAAIAVTFGAATPLAVGLMAGVVASTCVSVALSVPSVVSSIATACGWSADDPRTQGLICGIEMFVTLVSTFGAGMAVAGMKGIAIGAVTITKNAWLIGAGLLAQSLFTSGLLTTAFYNLVKVCGDTNEDDAHMAAMIMTVVFGILMALAMGGIASAGKSVAASAADNAEEAVAGVGDDVAQAAGNAAKAAVGEGVDASMESLSLTQQMLKNASRFFERVALEKGNIAFKAEKLAQLLNVGSQIQVGVFDLKMADISKAQMDLNTETSQCQAMLAFLQTMSKSYDIPIEAFNSDSQKINKEVADLISVFEQMLLTHTQILNKATHGG